MNIRLDSMNLLVACFNLMEERNKERFEALLKTGKIDLALNQLLQDGTFPEWFSKDFSFNHVYKRLNGLHECLSLASSAGLLRMDGTNFDYHLDLTPRMIAHLMTNIPMANDDIRKIAKRLDSLLNE